MDDARILLGVHYHGYGNWEKIRNDRRLGLLHKIAAAGTPAGETYLPRAPNLDARVNALLRKVDLMLLFPKKTVSKYYHHDIIKFSLCPTSFDFFGSAEDDAMIYFHFRKQKLKAYLSSQWL